MSRTVLSGELEPFGLLNVLQLLCGAGLTGALRVYESDLVFTIFLDDGHLVAASSPEQEPIGEKLVRKGRVTEGQLERALDLQRLHQQDGKGRPIGQILVQQGLVSRQDLEACVFDQIIESLCLTMELPRPSFSFAAMKATDWGDFRASMNVQVALLEAVRVADEVRREESVQVAAGLAV